MSVIFEDSGKVGKTMFPKRRKVLKTKQLVQRTNFLTELSEIDETNTLVRLTENSPTNGESLYKQTFDELSCLGKGGFGRVYCCRHKLDGKKYAIKIVPVLEKKTSLFELYVEEARILASLNHRNIVQYNNSWLEILGQSEKILEKSHESSLLSITNRDSDDDNDEDSLVEFAESNNALCNIEQKSSEWAKLYIQMELSNQTLKWWLENRYDTINNFNEKNHNINNDVMVSRQYVDTPLNSTWIRANLQIFTQLLKAVKYMHSKNIVHHDIKPANIFIKSNEHRFCVKLGDFGLACDSNKRSNGRHPSLGTEMYAAPEQLKGICDPKSDIYSLGIVLYELFENFGSESERIICFEKLQKTGLKSIGEYHQPELLKILNWLVNKSPKYRPSAKSLLKFLTQFKTNYEENQYKLELRKKDQEIERLKELLKNKNEMYL